VKFYLDCEFNGFDGELISLALVPADPRIDPFYEVVQWSERPVSKWIRENVVPKLDKDPVDRETVARALARYLSTVALQTGELPQIEADWPTDLVHFAQLFVLGPGMMVGVVDFDLRYRKYSDFKTAEHSTRPHNALADAQALRDYCVENGF
jgi:hypothetical protein